VAAVQELLIDVLVTASAIASGQFGGDDEAVMILFILTGCGLMAVKAVHAFPGMQTHLVFVNHRILSARVTLRALSRGPHQFRAGLIGLKLRPRPVYKERGQNQGEGNHDSQENGSKRHSAPLEPALPDIVVGLKQK
jgi:hypothetical protein